VIARTSPFLPSALFLLSLAVVAGPLSGQELGPADGSDLPPTDLDRVVAGSVAPDFTARTLAGETLTLSEFRGSHNVVLFFYRGHW